jgi:TPR repeat protein
LERSSALISGWLPGNPWASNFSRPGSLQRSGSLSRPQEEIVRIELLAVGALLLLIDGSAAAADFAKGLDALDRGDYAAALRELEPLAESGNARAEYRIGTMYALGLGVPRNYKEAMQWLGKSAAQGDAQAQNDLGVLYDEGRGVAPDAAKAVRWYREAAQCGLGAAQLNLALLYQEGRGVASDPIEAFAWASAAAERGERRAEKLVDSTAQKMDARQFKEAEERAAQYRAQYVVPSVRISRCG